MVRATRMLLAIGVAFGCAGVALASASAPDTKAMVVRLSDLPTGFRSEHQGYVSNAETVQSSAGGNEFVRLGRLVGYEVEFTKTALRGLVFVDANASIYRSAAGAHGSFAITARKAAASSGQRFPVDALGAESRLILTHGTLGTTKLDVYTVFWRHGKVFAAFLAGGPAGTVDRVRVVALARKQDTRIADALR